MPDILDQHHHWNLINRSLTPGLSVQFKEMRSLILGVIRTAMAAGQKSNHCGEGKNNNKYGSNLKKKNPIYVQNIFGIHWAILINPLATWTAIVFFSEPTSIRTVCHLFQTVLQEKLIKAAEITDGRSRIYARLAWGDTAIRAIKLIKR